MKQVALIILAMIVLIAVFVVPDRIDHAANLANRQEPMPWVDQMIYRLSTGSNYEDRELR